MGSVSVAEIGLRNRHGRKRKSGKRHPSGKLVVERVDRVMIAARMPHRGSIPQNLLLDQKSESELGRLNLLSKISDEQYEAGRIFAGVVARYRAVCAGPQGLAHGAHAFVCIGASPCEDCECRRRRAEYELADTALRMAGHQAAVSVRMVVIEDKPIPWHWNSRPLQWGLSALRQHFGVGPRMRTQQVVVSA